jgi:hypothetical protein
MKILFQPILALISTLILVFSFLSCGSNGNDKTQERISPTEDSSSVDKTQFLKDYESFVKEYCAVADQFENASMQKKATLGKKMAKEGMKFIKYQKTVPIIGSQLTDSEQEKLDQLNEKANKCAEKIKM